MAGYIGKGQPIVSNGAEKKFKYTATAGQTTFNATYSVGSVHVYRTGVRLTDGVDYTATDGSTVTLTTGCNAGDDVVVVSTSGFQVADAYTKAELANHDLVSVAANGNVTLGQSALTSNAGRLIVGTATDKNFVVQSGIDYPDGVAIAGINDSNGANLPLEFRYGSGDVGFVGNGLVRVNIDSAGRVTMPYQPAFRAATNYGLGITGNTFTLLTAGDIYVNTGNCWNGARFTAPVSGTYYVSANLMFSGSLSTGTSGSIYVFVNGIDEITIIAYDTYYNGPDVGQIVHLNQGDYLEFKSYGNNGGSGSTYNFICSGFLVG